MKIGKSELKALIKECLVELLAEGLGSNLVESVNVKHHGPRNRDGEPVPGQMRVAARSIVDPLAGRRRALDETRVAPIPQKTPTSIPANVAALTRDPVMAAIFADTAQTTLVEQANSRPGDAASQAASRVDPTQLFDEKQIDKWNEAAFKPARPGGLLSPTLPADFLNDLLKGG